jgi:hypothetical protein
MSISHNAISTLARTPLNAVEDMRARVKAILCLRQDAGERGQLIRHLHDKLLDLVFSETYKPVVVIIINDSVEHNWQNADEGNM